MILCRKVFSFFLETLCIFLTIVFARSLLSFLDYSVFNRAKYFPFYFDISKITTYLSLTLLIITILPVCFYHVKHAFQGESTLYGCLNVKELLARNRREIWSLSDCNETRTHNHLVRKRTLNHLAKLALMVQCESCWSHLRTILFFLERFGIKFFLFVWYLNIAIFFIGFM